LPIHRQGTLRWCPVLVDPEDFEHLGILAEGLVLVVGEHLHVDAIEAVSVWT